METLNLMGEDFTKAKIFPNDELYFGSRKCLLTIIMGHVYTLQDCVNKAWVIG